MDISHLLALPSISTLAVAGEDMYSDAELKLAHAALRITAQDRWPRFAAGNWLPLTKLQDLASSFRQRMKSSSGGLNGLDREPGGQTEGNPTKSSSTDFAYTRLRVRLQEPGDGPR